MNLKLNVLVPSISKPIPLIYVVFTYMTDQDDKSYTTHRLFQDRTYTPFCFPVLAPRWLRLLHQIFPAFPVSKLDFHRLDLSYNEITGGDFIVGSYRYPLQNATWDPRNQALYIFCLSKGACYFSFHNPTDPIRLYFLATVVLGGYPTYP